MIARTEGNPFFLEESVRTLVETGVLVGEPGAYRLAQALPTIQVPATVQAVLAARIDRLPPEEKRLLQTAAVIGTEVPLPLLQAIADLPEAALHRGLAHLQAAEFLYETRLFPEPEYTFKHALTHEVAYGSLLLERRRVLHARLVEALEALAPERVAEQVERLAHHALRGEVWDKAVHLLPAGRRQGQRPRRVPRGGGLLRAGPPGPRAPARGRRHPGAGHRAPPRCWDARCAHWESMGGASPCWARPRPWPGRSTIGPGWDGCWPGWPMSLRLTGDPDGAIAAGQQALELAAALGDSALQVQASYHLGQVYYAIGDFGRAAELLRRNVEAADRESGTPSTDVRIESRAWLARTLSALGAFAEGRRHGEEALRLATLEGRGHTPIIAHGCLGQLYLAQGDLEHAIRVLEQGLALCRASGNRNWLRPIAADLGSAYCAPGAPRGGARAAGGGDQRKYPHGRAGISFPLGRMAQRGLSSGGTRRGGLAARRQALDLARQQKERGDEALALHQLGAVHAHADPPDVAQAEAHYQQALALAEELGMRPLVAHCHLGLGRLYHQTGQREQARAALTTAIDLYRAMDMTFWLPQAEAALAQGK